MSNYVKSVNFAAKDALTTGDPAKAAKGTEVNTEFDNIATAISSKEDSANKGVANGFAGLDSGGKLSDTLMSTNIAKYNATSNIFTGSGIEINRALPFFRLTESDAATSEKVWIWQSEAGTLVLRARDDTGAGGSSPISLSRSGTTTTAIALTSTALTWNGNTLFTTANDGTGSLLDSDLLDGQEGSFYRNASNLNAGTVPTARLDQTAFAISANQVGTNVTGLTSSFSIASNHIERILTCNSASTINVTLDGGIFSTGDSAAFIRLGAGAVNFVAGTSQTINSPAGLLSISAQYGTVVATYRATNTWVLSGNLG